MRSMRVVLFSATCVVVCLLISFGVAAQNSRGSLTGTVNDTSGGRIASAKVVATAVDSSLERTATSDSRGEFRMDDLLPGAYTVTVNAPGMALTKSDVTVEVATVKDITVTLKPAVVTQTVNVTGEASSITTQQMDPTTAMHQGVVTSNDIRNLPLAHRTFANIAFLVPGTEPVEPSDPTKARIMAVSFGGSSGLNVELSVDGGDNSDDYIGGFLQNFSVDAIQEFAVRTAMEDADTGRTTAGSVVITTKRGSNDWHGDGAFYERAAALNARLPIDNPAPDPKQPFSRQNYIATLGGPIKKDKLFFFSSFEYVPENASIAYSPASLAQFNALATLAADGLIPGVAKINVPTSVAVPFHDYIGDARLDWVQSSKSQWFVRFANDNYTTRNDLVEQATLPSTGASSLSNYLNLLVSQTYAMSPSWLGVFTFDASYLHHTEKANSDLGFALAFPFSSTASTISGFETFGDNQFVTPITAFPILRDQEKYQFRYDVSHAMGHHELRFGVNFTHEPVLSGALPGNAENLTIFAMDPTDYLSNLQQFSVDLNCTPTETLSVTPGTTCNSTPAGNGSFSQNVQRLGLYAQDSWRVTPKLTVNYGLRWETTFGLFEASGKSQLANPTLGTLAELGIPVTDAAPHDYRKQFEPRLGIAYALGRDGKTVIRAGSGLYFNDLAQNGWVTAFQAVNGGGATGAVIDPNYHTPYALHATAGVEHAFNSKWTASADYTHETGMHGYRRYFYAPEDVTVFRTDNRSSYNGLSIHVQGNISKRFNVTFNYTLSKAMTWGCVLGELFDYVNGVCNPRNPFAPGDYGPSGEDVRHRAILAGTYYAPKGFEVSMLTQAESARPFTLTTPVDVNGFGDTLDDRAIVNGVQTTLDEFRGTPFVQVDMRVSRPFVIHERWSVTPFVEFFNLLNRNNPGANYVTNLAALPVNSLTNATAICLNASCSQFTPITSLNQLREPAGALGDFFGPGTTVGVPFAAQIGIRAHF
jgi:Carboxypeptidase regulatory-like domain/TonB dependent receptor